MSADNTTTRATKLGRHARPLRPIRAPFYVSHATTECVLPGWWWQPAGADKPEPLAQNYETAFVKIDRLRDRAKVAA